MVSWFIFGNFFEEAGHSSFKAMVQKPARQGLEKTLLQKWYLGLPGFKSRFDDLPQTLKALSYLPRYKNVPAKLRNGQLSSCGGRRA